MLFAAMCLGRSCFCEPDFCFWVSWRKMAAADCMLVSAVTRGVKMGSLRKWRPANRSGSELAWSLSADEKDRSSDKPGTTRLCNMTANRSPNLTRGAHTHPSLAYLFFFFFAAASCAGDTKAGSKDEGSSSTTRPSCRDAGTGSLLNSTQRCKHRW